jgi:hypothetical protein
MTGGTPNGTDFELDAKPIGPQRKNAATYGGGKVSAIGRLTGHCSVGPASRPMAHLL